MRFSKTLLRGQVLPFKGKISGQAIKTTGFQNCGEEKIGTTWGEKMRDRE